MLKRKIGTEQQRNKMGKSDRRIITRILYDDMEQCVPKDGENTKIGRA